MQMGTFTKIFLQFPPDKQFWDPDTQFFLYADSAERGQYPVWQSLSLPGFLNNSGILVVMLVGPQSYRAESQSDEVTQTQVMAVLRIMFGDDIPDPIDFMYPRWSQEPWAHGSYSNWPPGLSIETHQNLRANLGRLYFAGEATSAEYFAFLQGESTFVSPQISQLRILIILGAYYEGKYVGQKLGQCITRNDNECEDELHYDPVHRCTSELESLSRKNGWGISDL
jgi:polyamine oxidase